MAHGVLLFGDCSIHIASRELLRNGQRVSLSPVVFDCIAYLIRHRDRAVGRDELVAAVWGRTSISDAVMGKTILTARRAIGDTAEEQRFLRTVPRFGYQWGAPTREERADAPGEPPVATPADRPSMADYPDRARSTPRIRAVILAAGVVALLLLIGGLVIAQRGGAPAAAPVRAGDDLPADLTIVLPVDVAGTADDDWMRLGLMDLLATRLRNAGLGVLSSDSVVRLAPTGTPRDAAIAAARGFAERSHLVVPVVRRSDSGWVVRADLLEPDGSPHAVEASGDNVIVAAGGIVDRLLELRGRRAADSPPDTARLSQVELLQRIDAARLAGDPAQARALIAAVHETLRASPEVQLRSAQIDLRVGEFEAARARLETLAGAVSAEADPLLHARVQGYRCVALARVGQLDAGIDACDRAIALLETRNRPDDLGRVYSDRGIIRTLQGRYDASAQDFARARIALTLAGDALLLAKVDGNESVLDMAQGRYAEAVTIQQRIGERFERFGMGNELVASMNNRTTAHLALLQPSDALKTSDLALAHLGGVTDASIRFFTRLQRADTLESNGRLGEARILLDGVIAETDAAQYAAERATARASEARIDLADGQADAALLLSREAIAALASPPYSAVRAGAWLSCVRSLDRLGRSEDAGRAQDAFTAWASTVDDPVTGVYASLAQAEHAAAAKHADSARSRYEDALARAKRWGVPDALTETVTSYGRFLLVEGDVPAASAVIGLVARYASIDFDAAVLQAQLYRALGQSQPAQAALAHARSLAGERPLPPDLLAPAGVGGQPAQTSIATPPLQPRNESATHRE